MNKIEYKDSIAFHPGYYIKEYLKGSKFNRNDFAKKLNMTLDELENLIDGNEELTEEVISTLSELTKTSRTLWLNLNRRYKEDCLQMSQK